jgi:hypothetical protein
MMRRVEACIESHGGHLEHLFTCALSAIALKLNVSGHTFIWTFFPVLVSGNSAQTLSTPFSYTLYTAKGKLGRESDTIIKVNVKVNVELKVIH